MKHSVQFASFVLALVIVVPALTSADPSPTPTPKHLPPQHVTAHFPVPVNAPLGYRIEMQRQFANNQPYTGALVFKLNSEGILNGVYESDSIRPDPWYGQKIPVTGTVSSGNQIRIQIGTGPAALTVRGEITTHTIKASAQNASNGILLFTGERVHLQSPPQNT